MRSHEHMCVLGRGESGGSRSTNPNSSPPPKLPASATCRLVSLHCTRGLERSLRPASCGARRLLSRRPPPAARGRAADLHQGCQCEESGHQPVAAPPQGGSPAPLRRRHGLWQSVGRGGASPPGRPLPPRPASFPSGSPVVQWPLVGAHPAGK